MNSLLKEISNFEAIQEFFDNNEGSFIELLFKYYENLGKELGFDVERDFCEENLCISLCWLDSGNVIVAFEFCFGNTEEALGKIAKLCLCNAELKVLISSSEAKSIDFSLMRRALTLCDKLAVLDLYKEEIII